MSDILNYTNGSKNPKLLFDTLMYKVRFAKDNPNYFYPSGIWVFCGPQGSGKTLSAVSCLKKMKKDYPNSLVVSNLVLKDVDFEVIEFTGYEQLLNIKNGIDGVIFLIDEIHVLWNSLESKEIPISEMATFCQMRKDRRVIIGTSQVYSRIAKPIREQLQYIVDCHNLFNIFQFNDILDPTSCQEINGHLSADKIGRNFWFHSPSLYKSYDTLFKIEKFDRVDQVQKKFKKLKEVR